MFAGDVERGLTDAEIVGDEALGDVVVPGLLAAPQLGAAGLVRVLDGDVALDQHGVVLRVEGGLLRGQLAALVADDDAVLRGGDAVLESDLAHAVRRSHFDIAGVDGRGRGFLGAGERGRDGQHGEA